MLKSSSVNASQHKLLSLDVWATYGCLHQFTDKDLSNTVCCYSIFNAHWLMLGNIHWQQDWTMHG